MSEVVLGSPTRAVDRCDKLLRFETINERPELSPGVADLNKGVLFGEGHPFRHVCLPLVVTHLRCPYAPARSQNENPSKVKTS